MTDIPSKLGVPDWEFRVVVGRTQIDYDPNKEAINREKHGYSLESIVEQVEMLILPTGVRRPYIISDGFEEEGEVRHMHMGVDDSGKIVFFVTTMRQHETIRIISYRRAKTKEKQTFLEQTGYAEQTS